MAATSVVQPGPGRSQPAARGPRGLPLVGVAPRIKRDPLAFAVRMVRDHGDIVPLNVAGQRVVMVSDPTLLAHVMQRNAANYRKSRFYEGVIPVLGEGFLTSEGDTWLRQRRASAPAFKGAALAAMCADMGAAVDATLERWQTPAETGAAIDIAPEMMRQTLQIAVRTLFGSTLDDDTAQAVSDALAVVLRTAERRVWAVASLPLWVPTAQHRAFAEAVRVMDRVFVDLIEARRSSGARPGDLLDLLCDAYAREPRMLRDLVISILLAAHETTASGLAWTFYLLSRHPEWAARVREEAGTVLGDAPPDIKALHQMPMTRAVFEEALRLYPPLWTYSREAVGRDSLGEVPLRKGDTVMICPYAIHRNPRVWPDPDSFAPERFIGEATRRRHAYSYLPFAAGPRSCLGDRFAMTEAMIVLAKTLQRYSLDLVPGHPVVPEPMITLRPRHGVRMRLTPVH